MDRNKKIKLHEIQYVLRQTCERCVHANFSPDGWGTCGLFTYEHEKHSGEPRELSINRSGWCPSFLEHPDDFRYSHFKDFEERTDDGTS